jgi:uncharacterized protein (TIGR00251 family)
VGDSIRLKLRVVPGAARSRIAGRYGAGWKVRVSAAPEAGKANAAVVQILAETLTLAARDIEIVSGLTARDKIVSVRVPESSSMNVELLERRLAAASAAGKDLR